MSDENEILEGMDFGESSNKDSDLDSSSEAESQSEVDALLDGNADAAPKGDEGPSDQAAIDAMMEGGSPEAGSDGPSDQAAIDAMMEGGAPESGSDGPSDQAAIDAMMEGGGEDEPPEPKSNQPPHHDAIEKVIDDTNYLLTDVEGLIVAKVFYGLHEAYYDSWVRDARDNHSLIMRLNRRLQRYRGEIPKSKGIGGPR